MTTSSTKQATQSTAPKKALGAREVRELLVDTAHHVKVMKASWLRVAMNLKVIREHDLWQHSPEPCQNFEEYIFGVLKLNRAVARRMLQAMDYTSERRPAFISEFQERGEAMDVPSYDTVNQLRRAEARFEGREEEFSELETKVYDEGVGRMALKQEIDSRLGVAATAEGPAENPRSLGEVVRRLKDLERELLELDVQKEVHELMFRLVEMLAKGVAGEGEAPRA